MNCKICNSKMFFCFDSKIMGKYLISYFCCKKCGFIQTEKPFWLKEAYKNPINLSDTGQLSRNLYFSRFSSVLISFLVDNKGKFLDYAGGYGIFTRLMRDIGFDFEWYDPYTENIFAKGFEKKHNNYSLITCFECLEHLEKPTEEIKRILKMSDNLLFSTELVPVNIPSKEWLYYGFDHGQHISFYSNKSLSIISSKFGFNYYSFGWLNLFTKQKLSFFKLFILKNKFLLFLFFFIIKYKKNSKTMTDSLLMRGNN